MKLQALAATLPRHRLEGNGDVEIRGIAIDSRAVGGGDLFVCLEGLASDGHDFAAAAVRAGAAAVLLRRPDALRGDVPMLVVPDTRDALARISAAFHGHPARRLTVIGVTGTNGKTTTTQILGAIGAAAGKESAVFGTLGNRTGGTWQPTRFTTPEAPEVQRLLREAADRGVTWVAMEVSSHALAQKRVHALDFAAAVFTNLTRDHLDFHPDLEAYFEAKALLFDPEARAAERIPVAIIGIDDAHGRELARRFGPSAVTYGFHADAHYRATDPRTTVAGVEFTLRTPRGDAAVRAPLVGDFNILNLAAAVAVAVELGVPLDAAVRGAASVPGVPGRMEKVPGDRPFLVLVDYAHTPDGLERALRAARGFTAGRLWVVFGCGGDRDRGKRPEMGMVASTLADHVIVTSDNPRTEDPAIILDEILAGVPSGAPVERELDRARAIASAVERAEAGDTVLIAGKGHETVQIVGREERPFDDRQVAAAAMQRRD